MGMSIEMVGQRQDNSTVPNFRITSGPEANFGNAVLHRVNVAEFPAHHEGVALIDLFHVISGGQNAAATLVRHRHVGHETFDQSRFPNFLLRGERIADLPLSSKECVDVASGG